jgi:hypothetical protein
MSITVVSSPNTTQPAYNQMLFSITSTRTAEPNFNFIADVYVAGVLVSRLLFPKQPGSTGITIDISPVIKNYVTYDMANVYSATWAFNSNSQIAYFVQFGELYDVATVPTVFANLTRNPTSGSKYALNSIFDFEQFTPNIMASYNVSTFGYLLKNNSITIKEGQDLFLSYYDPSAVVNSGKVLSGLPEYIVASPSVANQYVYNISVLWSEIVSQGLDTAVIANGFYDVELYDNSTAVVATIRVAVNSCQEKFPIYRLHWLNNLGGWDSYNFNKVSQESETIDRSQFKKITPLGYTANTRLITTYNTTIKDNVLCTSDWLSDDESVWMKSLLESPIVMLERDDNTFVPINLSDSAYDVKKYMNGRALHNLSIRFDLTYNRYRQSL